jgi:hypothetical protein
MLTDSKIRSAKPLAKSYKLTVGITNDGLAVVITPDDDGFPARFESLKITGWMLEHHLDNQLTRLILERKALMDGLVTLVQRSAASISYIIT